MEAPEEESTPLSPSLPDLFWWLPTSCHPYGGFFLLWIQQLPTAASLHVLVPIPTLKRPALWWHTLLSSHQHLPFQKYVLKRDETLIFTPNPVL